ncbi:helix-turn-helix transcriptional regulator [Flavobacteriaceae bacterium TP-CH-4]|uniref:Helix-turn-helix transcriptional regulator n=1 Tax=Pelagihabitans pacificus TaxID=2696054 RepID=A0A967E880_9FLAO|nr:AraC family transcriptional regulator [Pelagihabitans pacificus]NHF61024.1 helix-turn-helix transcriptional regulator [Pelagihabitans pacificus]
MQEIVIKSSKDELIVRQLKDCLEGTLDRQWGESVLKFENNKGKGLIRSIEFDWGVSLLDCDICLNETTKIIFNTSKASPVEFIFISEGSLQYQEGDEQEMMDLERYQNIIISPKRASKKTFVFPANTNLKINFIRIRKKEFLKKRNNNVTYLNDLLFSVFQDENSDLPYAHTGSYSLKIADQVKALGAVRDSGIVRTLSLEGRLYLILALQLMEHHEFECKEVLPESLSKSDIRRIHQLSEFIVDSISEPMTIKLLSEESGLSPKKLQLGFRLLYSKSVNEYVRQIKLEIARDLLKNSDMSVSEIVYHIGIKSRSYFSKIFWEEYAILPTDYKKTSKRRSS